MKIMIKNFALFLIFVTYYNLLTAQIRWDYPIKPGSNEWRNLNSYQNMLNACQIPVDILPNISTSDLLEIWLNYPFLYDITYYSLIQNGFDQQIKNFNGLKHLLNRDDIGKEIMVLLEKNDPQKIEKYLDTYGKGRYTLSIGFIQVLLSQPIVLDKLSDTHKRYCVKTIIERLSRQNEIAPNAIYFWQETGLLLIARILESYHYEKFMFFLNNKNVKPEIFNSGAIQYIFHFFYNDIINLAQEFLNDK
jgi:hypothetical protein